MLSDCKSAMGDELGELYFALWQDLARTSLNWIQYLELFAEGEDRVAVLNRTASRFFSIVQDVLFNDVVLGITRLTEPSKSKGVSDRTLSVDSLIKLADDRSLQAKLGRGLHEARRAAKPAVEWRNRRIAHRDLRLALNRPTQPLPSITVESLTGSLRALESMLNSVAKHYMDGGTSFCSVIHNGGARSALVYLSDGLRREVDRREAARRGVYDQRLWDRSIGVPPELDV